MKTKILRIFIVIFSLVCILNLKANAETTTLLNEDEYKEFSNFSGYDVLEKHGLALEDEDFVSNLNPSNLFEVFKELISNGYKTPLASFLALSAVGIITAACSSFLEENRHFLSFLIMAAAGTVLLPLFNTLVGAANTLSAVSNFMLSFIPVFISVVISSGFIGTAKISSPLLLFVASFVSKASTTAFLPLMGGYLSLTISSSISPVFSLNGFANSIKSAANYIMGFCTTIFLGVLSISSGVSASSDSLAIKTTRFLASGVPVVGGAISESLTVTVASLELLKTGVGSFGVLAIIVILLPTLITLLFWKASIFLSSFVAEVLSIKTLSDFLKSVNAVISVTIGILIFVGLLFIIGLGILIRLKR